MITKGDLKYNEDCYGGMKVKTKAKKVKMQCNACGHIDSESVACPKCNGGMFKYINRIGK